MNGHTERVGTHLTKEIRLALAHQAVINVDADQAIADRAVNERGGDSGVDSTGKGTKHAIGGPNLCGNRGNGIFGNAPRGPVGRCLRNVVDKVAQQALPARRMHHLGVELNPPEIA